LNRDLPGIDVKQTCNSSIEGSLEVMLSVPLRIRSNQRLQFLVKIFSSLKGFNDHYPMTSEEYGLNFKFINSSGKKTMID